MHVDKFYKLVIVLTNYIKKPSKLECYLIGLGFTGRKSGTGDALREKIVPENSHQ